MKKPIIYITRKLPESLLQSYKEYFEFHMWKEEESSVPREILLKESKTADGLLCMVSDAIDAHYLTQNSQLKIVANNAVGYDNIDLQTAKKNEITVTNTPDVLTETTADLTFALLMATSRRLIEANQVIRDNQWKNWSPYFLAGTDIYNKTIGIVGMGRIGTAVARRAKGFGMRILYHNRRKNPEIEKELQATYVDFRTLLTESDFVVSLVPLTKETKHLFNKNAFHQMKQEAIFINVSRGAVVQEDDLFEALNKGVIRAAGLDVFETEPITADHPYVSLDNVICLPHIGSASEETRTKMIQLCLDNIYQYFYGDGPITPVF